MMSPFNVFIGYDPKEHEAYLVAKSTVELASSLPVLVTPLNIEHLSHLVPAPIRLENGRLWDIESDAPQATEFARSRFCVPFVQRSGWCLFMDCDVVVNGNVADLLDLADPEKAVMVVKHDHKPKAGQKMDGQIQTSYPRKNWSSVVLWNCSHPAHHRLTKERLNRWPGRDLHAFKWLQEDEIGELPVGWNHLVGVDDPRQSTTAQLLHFTLGGPWIPGWENGPLDWLWKLEADRPRSARKIVAFAA